MTLNAGAGSDSLERGQGRRRPAQELKPGATSGESRRRRRRRRVVFVGLLPTPRARRRRRRLLRAIPAAARWGGGVCPFASRQGVTDTRSLVVAGVKASIGLFARHAVAFLVVSLASEKTAGRRKTL